MGCQDAELQNEIANAGGIQPLLSVAMNSTGLFRLEAVHALGAVAEANPANITQIASDSFIAMLLKVLVDGSEEEQVISLCTLSSLMASQIEVIAMVASAGGQEILAHLARPMMQGEGAGTTALRLLASSALA